MTIPAIAYVQPIFAPSEAQSERNLSSIRSLAAYLTTFQTSKVTFHFGGWGVEPFITEIESEICALFGSFSPAVKRFDRNFGKAVVVNDLVKTALAVGEYPDLLFLSDSDIIYDLTQLDIFGRIRKVFSVLPSRTGKPFGVMALGQDGGCVHLPQARQNSLALKVTDGPEEVVFLPKDGSGIAGSCIVCSTTAWTTVNGYRPMGVYAGDDAYLFRDAFDSGFSCSLSDTIRVTHPPDQDHDYARWKQLVCFRDSDGVRRDDISTCVSEAESFWARKNAEVDTIMSAVPGPSSGLITFHNTVVQFDAAERTLIHRPLLDLKKDCPLVGLANSAPFSLIQIPENGLPQPLGDDALLRLLSVSDAAMAVRGPPGSDVALAHAGGFLTAVPGGEFHSDTPYLRNWEGLSLLPSRILLDIINAVRLGGTGALAPLQRILKTT